MLLPNVHPPLHAGTTRGIRFAPMPDSAQRPAYLRTLGSLIFFSRWLQAPLYVGLIVAQAIYVYKFFVELTHLVHGVFYPVVDPATGIAEKMTEADIMVMVLGLIDVVMIANLLVMVIVGGYETFVSRLNLRGHPDEPEWLSHVNAGALKVKLATALIGISSIHLLRTFIEIGEPAKPLAEGLTRNLDPTQAVFWQVIVHLTFVVSAILLAITDRITTRSALESKAAAH
jgi:uncharacterized protein (TIGR00645 family)